MRYLSEVLQFSVLIPASILALLPMKNQFRFSAKHIAAVLTLLLLCIIPLCAWITSSAGIASNIVLFPLIVLFFFCYHYVVKSPWEISLSVFLLVMSVMSFPPDISIAIDAAIHPTEVISDGCIIATSVQLILSFLFTLLLSYPLHRFLTKLVDNLYLNKAWIATLPVPFIFILLNVLIQPQYYETLYTNRLFVIYICYLVLAMFLLFIIYLIFYLVAVGITQSAQNRERMRFLEMQESQYLAQQQYIAESARLRHDFRQQLGSMAEMAANGQYDELKSLLLSCVNSLPARTTVYCENVPVNALLNYYASLMDSAEIQRDWKIQLPPSGYFRITDMELCSLLGNILENACYGCGNIAPVKRYHILTICVKHQNSLYISSANSFDGYIKKSGNVYRSTHHAGSGLGLYSINTTAEKYDGFVHTSHTDKEFTIDVVVGQ